MNTHWIKRHVTNCQDAMDADTQMGIELPSDERHLTLYEWPHRAISFGYKQNLPDDLNSAVEQKQLDGGRRATGGGIVFHNPGDLVFACAAPLNDPLFPDSLKDKMGVIRDQFKQCFLEQGLLLHPRTHDPLENSMAKEVFCASYPNPYELFYNDSKILALTLRRFKHSVLIQGIVHLQDNATYFSDYAHYQAFFSQGLPKDRPITYQTILHSLQKLF